MKTRRAEEILRERVDRGLTEHDEEELRLRSALQVVEGENEVFRG
jgi:hypothetical protein